MPVPARIAKADPVEYTMPPSEAVRLALLPPLAKEIGKATEVPPISNVPVTFNVPEKVSMPLNVCVVPNPATVAEVAGNVIVVESVPASVSELLTDSVFRLVIVSVPVELVSVRPLMLVAEAAPSVGVVSVKLVAARPLGSVVDTFNKPPLLDKTPPEVPTTGVVPEVSVPAEIAQDNESVQRVLLIVMLAPAPLGVPPITGLVSVLLISVCVAVSVTSVSVIAGKVRAKLLPPEFAEVKVV